MSKQKKILHGAHNKALCEFLFEQGKYFDWAVTTAFYSAIHFVESKLLPCSVNNITCSNIADVRKAYPANGRHEARDLLTKRDLPRIAARYSWLDDKSRYSRYTTYKVSKAEAEKALQYLRVIEKACLADASAS